MLSECLYLVHHTIGMSWAFWAVSPGGDVGGILKDDWITVEEEKLAMIRSAMAPLIPLETPEQSPDVSHVVSISG